MITENAIKSAIEDRIVNVLPGVEVDPSGKPSSCIVLFRNRRIITSNFDAPEVSENVNIYGRVDVDVEIHIYSDGFLDKAPLFLSFMKDPFLSISDENVTWPIEFQLKDTTLMEGIQVTHFWSETIRGELSYYIYENVQ